MIEAYKYYQRAIADASRAKVVISCASSLDLPSCLALIEGLALRKQNSGVRTYYIHTSGTSNFGDQFISARYTDSNVRTDEEDIYTWERDNADGWPTRKVDVEVIDAGERLGVYTAIVNPPLIYGTGTGPVHKQSIQIPALVKASLQEKQAVVLGSGLGFWNYIHITDVSSFYTLLVNKILHNEPVTFGKKGYYFLESGETSWSNISTRIAQAGVKQKIFATEDLKTLTPEELCKNLGISFLNPYMVEVIWGSNARIKGVQARRIGWSPRTGEEEFNALFHEEIAALSEGS